MTYIIHLASHVIAMFINLTFMIPFVNDVVEEGKGLTFEPVAAGGFYCNEMGEEDVY